MTADNNEFDHNMHDEALDDEGGIEVNIDPKDDRLDALGIPREEFEEALLNALDSYNDEIDAETGEVSGPLEDVMLTIRGATHRLGDLADITIGEDGFDEDEDDEEE